MNKWDYQEALKLIKRLENLEKFLAIDHIKNKLTLYMFTRKIRPLDFLIGDANAYLDDVEQKYQTSLIKETIELFQEERQKVQARLKELNYSLEEPEPIRPPPPL